MKDSIQGLRKDLSQIESLLTRETLLSFSPEERRALLEESVSIRRKLDSIAESYLTVGLLGGTGVGKSTLMNALAGSEIALTSHRRPQTDKVLIYRHADAALPPALGKTQVPWREYTHDVEAIRQILLCDLPDFDSLVGEHRQRVLSFLEHIDVLVWVSSPEKYADARFYDFLGDVPKARQNFYFVLNKVDIFFHDEALSKGYDRLRKVTERFRQHLTDKGVLHPLIYAVSGLDAARPHQDAAWNQFAGLRHQIFQNRDIKEVMAIKTANIDVEVQKLFSTLEKEIFNLGVLHQVVSDFIGELEKERAQWVSAGEEAFGLWLARNFNRRAFFRIANPSPLVGPGYVLAVLIQEWHRLRRGDDEAEVISDLFKTEGPLVPLRLELERLEDRMAHQILHCGLPSVFIEESQGILNAKKKWEDVSRRVQHFMEMRVTSLQNVSSRGFRAMQYAIYSLIFAFLLFALGGESAWRDLFDDWEFSRLVRLISGITNTIFSPAGLAALGSYILLQVFLGFRFYGRYKKSLRRRTQKFIDSLKLELAKMWEEELSAILARFGEYKRELESQLSAISLLHEARKKD